MEPYGNIEPFKVSSTPLSTAIGKIGQGGKGGKGGGLLDLLGGISGHRALERMHQAQIAHEATMHQATHESNLELIDKIHSAGLSLDQAKTSGKLEKMRLEGKNARKMQALTGAQELEKATNDAVIAQSHKGFEADLDRKARAQDAMLEISKANAEADRVRNAARDAGVVERTNREHQVDQLHRLVEKAAPGSKVAFEEPGKFKVGMTLAPAPIAAPAADDETKPADKPKKPSAKAKPKSTTTTTRKPRSTRPKLDTGAADAYND